MKRILLVLGIMVVAAALRTALFPHPPDLEGAYHFFLGWLCACVLFLRRP